MHLAALLFHKLLSDGKVTPLLPHTSHLLHLIRPRPYRDWIDYDLELLRHCHAVLRFGNESSGAEGEIAAAVELSLPVFYYAGDLYRWAAARSAA